MEGAGRRVRDERNLQMAAAWAKPPLTRSEAIAIVRGDAQGLVWQRLLCWREELGIPAACRSIELGCGYGKISMLLGLSGADVTLVDYNAAALDAAASAHHKLGLDPDLVRADLLDLPAALEGQFDVACSFGTLEHFLGVGRQAAFGACARVLRPGGLLFFVVPNRYAIWYRIGFGARRLLGLVPKAFQEWPYSRRELVAMAASHRVRVLEAGGGGSFSGDFRHWIGENAASLVRKLARRPRPGRPAREATLEGFDPSRRQPEPQRSWLDRRFSYSLLFAGEKL